MAHLDLASLRQLVDAGSVETVVAAFTDHYGRLMGKRFDASFFLDNVAAHGTHAYMHGEKVAFGLLTQLMLESQPQATINEVIAFAKSVGLPTTFAEIGIPNPSPETLQTIATRATLPGETIHNEPMPVTPVMVVEAMRAADAAGQSL